LEIYSGVTVPKIIEIGRRSTKLLQKQKRCSFFEHHEDRRPRRSEDREQDQSPI